MKKKIIYSICVVILFALVTTSCKKKEEVTTFTAQIALLEDGDDARFYINPSTFMTYWMGNEQVKVYNINEDDSGQSITQIYQVSQSGASTGFTGSGIGYNSVYYAFTPAEMAPEALMEGNYQRFEVLDHQPLYLNPVDPAQWMVTVSGTSLPMAATCTYENPYFQFKHIFGIVRLKLHCDPYVPDGGIPRYRKLESVTFTDNHFNLSGFVTLKPHKIDGDILGQIMTEFKASPNKEFKDCAQYESYVINELGYSAQGGGKSVTYDLTELGGLQFQPNVEYLTILVGLRPGALAYGFNLSLDVFQEGLGVRTISYDFEANRDKVVEPGRIKSFTLNITDEVNEAFGLD